MTSAGDQLRSTTTAGRVVQDADAATMTVSSSVILAVNIFIVLVFVIVMAKFEVSVQL